jgi:hypothetical protein
MIGEMQSNFQEDAFDVPRSGKHRYFFDIQDGDRILNDTEGLELDGIEAARLEAIRALPDMARDALPDGDQQTFVVRVRDESGQTVLIAALSFVVQWLV